MDTEAKPVTPEMLIAIEAIGYVIDTMFRSSGLSMAFVFVALPANVVASQTGMATNVSDNAVAVAMLQNTIEHLNATITAPPGTTVN